jgi:hypothetical protein
MTQPNYLCPCCGHKGSLTPDLFDVVMGVVSEEYRIDRHQIEWSTQFDFRAKEACSAVVLLLKNFSGAPNKDINPLFHWPEFSSNATVRIARATSLYESNQKFAERFDRMEERCGGEFRKKIVPHAICA